MIRCVLVVNSALAFTAPQSFVPVRSPSRTPVCALSEQSAKTMSSLQSRILAAGDRKKSLLPFSAPQPRKALRTRVSGVVRDVLKVVCKSLLITLVLQPAIASAAPYSFKYLAYLGYGREEGEIAKADGTTGFAVPVIVAGLLLSRSTMKKRNREEISRVKKANEKIREAEDEFFAVQGEAESDVDIMSELRQRASNSTNATDVGGGPRGGGGGPPPPPRPKGPRPPSGTAARRPSSGASPSRPAAGQRPPAGQRPAPGQRPPAGQRPTAGQRPPSGQRPASGQRPPAGQRPRPPSSSARPPSARPSSRSSPSSARPGASSQDIARLNRMFNQTKSN